MAFLLSAIGTPPQPGTLAFKNWCAAASAACLAYVERPRTRYYFDPVGGNDGNVGTTTAAPWKTLSKLATHMATLDASGFDPITGLNVDYALLRWSFFPTDPADASSVCFRTTTGINLNKPFTKLSWWEQDSTPSSNYDLGPCRALVTSFAGKTAASFTLSGAGPCYEAAEATAVYWVCPSDGSLSTNVLIRCTSVAECNANPGSWFWDSGASKLYVHWVGSVAPPNVWMARSSSAGIQINADGCIVEGVHALGFGMQTRVHQSYCLYANLLNNQVGVFKDCVAAYGPYHVAGAYHNGASSGTVLFHNTDWGFARRDTVSGTTVGNSYGAAGGNECVVQGGRTLSGALKETDLSVTVNVGDAFLAHTGAGTMGIHIINEHTIDASSILPPFGPGRLDNLPKPDYRLQYTAYRGFWRKCSLPGLSFPFSNSVAIVACRLPVGPFPAATNLTGDSIMQITTDNMLVVGTEIEANFTANVDVPTGMYVASGVSATRNASGNIATTAASCTVQMTNAGTVVITTVTPANSWTIDIVAEGLITVAQILTRIGTISGGAVTAAASGAADTLHWTTFLQETRTNGQVLRCWECTYADWLHCWINVTLGATPDAGLLDGKYFGNNNSQNARFVNCIIKRTLGTSLYPNTPNQAPSTDLYAAKGGSLNCAYYQCQSATSGGPHLYQGYGSTTSPKTLTTAPAVTDPPKGSLLQGASLPQGWVVEETWRGMGDFTNVIGLNAKPGEGLRLRHPDRRRLVGRTLSTA